MIDETTGENDKKDIENSVESGNLRESTPQQYGYGKPPIHGQFSATNQPSMEKLKAAKAKKRATREFLRELLAMKYLIPDNSPIKKELEDAFGKNGAKGTIMDIMVRRQILKAVKGNDTQAFKAIMDQTFGLPKQQLEHSGVDGQPMQTQVVSQVIIANPHSSDEKE